ncbi:hypothetical protein [Alkalihalobacillus sp. CinArs1]|uniref:hypothetical protein n=1 Tax=Alkalihalobacillus sp. CinArs1 TaxID=2995314 RepID=UPI0022DD667E|nr:hypothetical protein [Alkalihalobacillus sp. CinArs1]
MAFKRLISFVILLFMLATSVSPVALAEVGELDYNNDNLNKTESDGDATANDGKDKDHWWDIDWRGIGNDIGDAFNKGRDALDPFFDTVGDMGDFIAGGWDRFTDWSSDTWNDFSNWSQDTWSSFTDWSANTWDSFTDWSANTWDAFVDGTVNTWNAFTNFTSNIWDATPNWVKSTLSFVGVGAGIVGAVALGVISAPVAIAAGIGAGIAGGAYYLMNRNSDYSFLGSLGWTAGGALLGGIGQATGAIAAVRAYLGRKAATGLLSAQINRYALGSWGAVAKRALYAYSKAAILPTAVVPGIHGFNFIMTGEINWGSMAKDTAVTFATAPLGGALVSEVGTAIRSGFRLVNPIIPAAGAIGVAGGTNLLMQFLTSGQASFLDFGIGAAVGGAFISLDILLSRYPDTRIQTTYEVLKKYLSDELSKIAEKEFSDKKTKKEQ